MDIVKGKLVNQDSGSELPFSLNPLDFQIQRSFDFDCFPQIGQPAPKIAFRCGNLSQLSFKLLFDKDADSKSDSSKVESFLKELNTINEAKKSVPVIEFFWGAFTFKGFIQSYNFHPGRFDNKGNISSVAVSINMLSNGDYENG